MNAGIWLADIADVGMTASAAITTVSVAAYAVRARGAHGRWWRSPTGLHLMCYMTALAWVLDQSVIALATGPGILVHAAPPLRPDWFAWERVLSFALLIPAVFAWRLVFILRPPGRTRRPGRKLWPRSRSRVTSCSSAPAGSRAA